MKQEDRYLAYLTRPQYLNLRDIHFDTRMYDLDRMIWAEKIYEQNEAYLEDIYVTGNFKIQRLFLANYKHYFILEQRSDEHLPLLFWVNTLEDTEQESKDPTNLIANRKYPWTIRQIKLENNVFKYAIHIGNVFNGYVQQKGIPNNLKSSEDKMYNEILHYIHGEPTDFEFKYSIFADYLIIYRAKLKKEPVTIDIDEILGLK